MSTYHVDTVENDSAETKEHCIIIGKLPKNAQLTIRDTGWSEEEKERMRQASYDGVDIIRAWYS